MHMTVYIPKALEAALKRRSEEARTTSSLLVQAIVRRELEAAPQRFSARFAALAGSWEDDRGADEIVADIRRAGPKTRRAKLR